MSKYHKYIDRMLSSNGSIWKQIWGAFLNYWGITIVLVILPILGILSAIYFTQGYVPSISKILEWHNYGRFFTVVLLLYVCCMTVCIAKKLTPIFNLRKQTTRATGAQITILAILAAVAIALLLIFEVTNDSPVIIPLTIIGAALGWVFQDTLKSIAAYLYLAQMGKLHIDDWIEVKSLGIDGEVQSITLTSVEIRNWDTTTSLFPTHVLLEHHFQNHQSMVKGCTFGRMMLKTFTIDTGWIKPLEEANLDCIQSHLDPNLFRAMQEDHELEVGKNNLHAYRSYLHHYLLMKEQVSHEPFLFVRLVEHVAGGIRIQIQAFLTATSMMAYEEEQSLVTEHVLESILWFGLRLYQSPRGDSDDDEGVYDDDGNYIIE